MIKKGFYLFKDILLYFYDGWKARLFVPYLKSFGLLLIFHLNQFRQSLYTKGLQIKKIDEGKVEKLKRVVDGLHLLLPYNPLFTYSILIFVKNPSFNFFKKAIESILHQTAPLEIIIGFAGTQKNEIHHLLQNLPDISPKKIKEFYFPLDSEKAEVLNALVEKSEGHFIFIMGQEDWIRPDLLFRYEQTLRIATQPEQTVLYCDENQINDQGYSIPLSEIQKKPFHFPFFFESFNGHGLLVSKTLWKKVGGLRLAYHGAAYDDLILRLNLEEANFQHIPLCLYSYRSASNSSFNFGFSRDIFLQSLSNYTKAKGLDWKWEPGYDNHVRAIPSIKQDHTIQIIIPFKDQKELTLRCIHCVLEQKGVEFKITALDNNSQDSSIGEQLRSLGAEVLLIAEPFNYSRLNNLAVSQTKTATECDLLLFLNNDVELQPGALAEMTRWIDQPQVGLVGCRLHYPSGGLQHGGVYLDYYAHPLRFMQWDHIEKMSTFEQMDRTKMLQLPHAVTAACALIKRQIFLEVGGFDEVWYPIAYSDTNLAIKLQRLGLNCFYTPYAVGIHHESISRKVNIEDYENSRWLHQLLQEKQGDLLDGKSPYTRF